MGASRSRPSRRPRAPAPRSARCRSSRARNLEAPRSSTNVGADRPGAGDGRGGQAVPAAVQQVGQGRPARAQTKIRFINYDYAKVRRQAERRRLIAKWRRTSTVAAADDPLGPTVGVRRDRSAVARPSGATRGIIVAWPGPRRPCDDACAPSGTPANLSPPAGSRPGGFALAVSRSVAAAMPVHHRPPARPRLVRRHQRPWRWSPGAAAAVAAKGLAQGVGGGRRVLARCWAGLRHRRRRLDRSVTRCEARADPPAHQFGMASGGRRCSCWRC